MKQCVKFPEDKFLAVRRCLVAICMGNRPAANLLSILLFRYNLRMENKDDAENQNAVKASKGESPDQDTSVRIFRTQAQLVDDMCGEMTEKTLHDTAVPMLQLLGFLDLEEHMIANCYILHVDLVQQALNLYAPGKKEQVQLEKFLISLMEPQLEKFRIDLCGLQLELLLIDKKFFLSGLEKVLIQNRNISNLHRGRKPKPQAARKAKFQPPKNIEEDTKKNIEEERAFTSVHAPLAPADFLPDGIDETDRLLAQSIGHDFSRDHHVTNCHNWRACNGGLQVVSCADYQASINSGLHEALTQPRTEAITLNGATNGQLNTLASASTPGEPDIPPVSAQTRHSHIPSSLQGIDGAATTGGSEPRASGNNGHSAIAATASQATLQQQAASVTTQNSTGTRQEKQVSQPPLSLQEDEPHIKPETPAQRRRRIEAREKEIWALVEEKLQTKYSKTQRQTKANTAGMENLIEDETDDQTIKDALDKLSNFWRMQFDLLKFHSLIPGLLAAQVPVLTKDGKQQAPAPKTIDYTGQGKRRLIEFERNQRNQRNLQA